jgi:hypothetical protein
MIRFMRSLILLLCGLLFSALCFAQGNIRGTVEDSTGKAVPFATVNLKNKTGNAIVAYATADDKGAYYLVMPSGGNPDSLLVEARCIGYKNQAKTVNVTAPVNFVLKASVN